METRVGPLTLRWQRRVLGVARAFRPDVLIVSGELGNVSSWLVCAWARLSGRPVVLWTSGWEPQPPGSGPYRVKRVVMRWYFQLASKTLVYSTKAMTDLVALGIAEDRLTVCRNAIEVSQRLQREPEIRATAAALRESEGIGDRVLFLSVGRVVQSKRLDLLVAAFEEVGDPRQAVLWVVGDGPQLAALKARTARSGRPNVKFWGSVFTDVDSYFAAADCFVLPGLGGLALNQAMLFGVPCVCSVADGTEDDLVIDGVTGVRFAPADVTSLAAALARVMTLKQDGSLRHMGDAARTLLLESSTVDHMVETFRATVPSVVV
ncbi:MAG: glycosyltransferase family 4 protein [Actinomycetota bacterium]|nr:glycosyltransferase family 4 protein [Actinomycetota bacterium]